MAVPAELRGAPHGVLEVSYHAATHLSGMFRPNFSMSQFVLNSNVIVVLKFEADAFPLFLPTGVCP